MRSTRQWGLTCWVGLKTTGVEGVVGAVGVGVGVGVAVGVGVGVGVGVDTRALTSVFNVVVVVPSGVVNKA